MKTTVNESTDEEMQVTDSSDSEVKRSTMFRYCYTKHE